MHVNLKWFGTCSFVVTTILMCFKLFFSPLAIFLYNTNVEEFDRYAEQIHWSDFCLLLRTPLSSKVAFLIMPHYDFLYFSCARSCRD